MDDITNNLLTANGEFIVFRGKEGADVLVEIDGNLGAGTVTLGRETIGTKSFEPYKDSGGSDITLAIGALERVTLGKRGVIALKVLGATAPSINLAVTPFRANYYYG